MQDFVQFLESGIKLLADRALPVTLVLGAIGAASMALWQVAKDLFSLHKSFNIGLVKEWAADETDGPDDKTDVTVENLVRLVAVGDKAKDALYSLNTAQLVGQLQAAGRLAVTDPIQHEDVLKFLVGARNKDLACTFINYARSETKQNPGTNQQETILVDEERRQRAIALCRDQVEHYIQRKFDTLQIRADWKWARLNRFAAIVLSILIAWAAFYMAGQAPSPGGDLGLVAGSGLVALVAGTIAGFIAPVAKDLVRAVRALRGR